MNETDKVPLLNQRIIAIETLVLCGVPFDKLELMSDLELEEEAKRVVREGELELEEHFGMQQPGKLVEVRKPKRFSDEIFGLCDIPGVMRTNDLEREVAQKILSELDVFPEIYPDMTESGALDPDSSIVKTIFIYDDQLSSGTIRFYVKDGDYSHLDKTIIDSEPEDSQNTRANQIELDKIIYKEKNTKLFFDFPSDEFRKYPCKVIVCGVY